MSGMSSRETDRAQESLDEAILAVAHATQELFEDLEQTEDGTYELTSDDVHQMRSLLGAWTRATETFLAAASKQE